MLLPVVVSILLVIAREWLHGVRPVKGFGLNNYLVVLATDGAAFVLEGVGPSWRNARATSDGVGCSGRV